MEPPPPAAPLDEALAVFVGLRPRLFGSAYRMLGSAAEAEDVVQEAWLRWQATDRDTVIDATGFLVTATTRLAINQAQSARVRRESYVGTWLPEPIDTRADPELGAVRGEALALAVLLLLEKLTPKERAAYVLREAFDYDYAQIADILELEEANVRQLVSRANKHIAADRRSPVDASAQRNLLAAFLEAAQRGDRARLESLFAADVVSYSDGGGIARAARVPVQGRARVAQFIASFASHFWVDASFTWTEANGRPAVVVSRGSEPFAFATIEASADGIAAIWWVLNPAKLASIAAAAGGSPEQAR
ncbi:MAG TPA: RNA polymerase sigma-70 factor [Polyangia bacterium]